jgi:peptidoglycan/LPS O-acetylase OafA/YrhL
MADGGLGQRKRVTPNKSGGDMFGFRASPSMVAPVNSTFRRDIAGLRAVAILAVVIYHLKPTFLPSGFAGVDIFFILSGYLITGLLWSEYQRSGSIDWKAFYARRIRRILPASLFLTVAVVVATFFILPFWKWEHILWQAAASTAFLANFFFAQQPSGYFAGASQNPEPLLHMWTLSLEEQFYILIPIIFMLLIAIKRMSKKHVAIIFLGLVLVSLVLALMLNDQWERTSFYLIHTRAWEFAIGGLLAVLLSNRSGTPLTIRSYWGIIASTAGTALIVIALTNISPDTTWPGIWTLALVTGVGLVLISGEHGIVNIMLGSKALVAVGALSYSWYLWHYPPLVLIDRKLFDNELLWYSTVLGVGLAGACISYFMVERPIRKIRVESPRTREKTLLLGIAITTTLAVILGAAAVANARYKDDVEETVSLSNNPAQSFGDESIRNTETPKLNHPKDNNAESHHEIDSSDKENVITNLNGKKVLVVGDSHSLHWEAAMKEAVEDRLGGTLEMHSLLSCPAIDVYVTKLDGSAMRSGCTEHRNAFWVKSEEVDIVILSQAEHYINRIRDSQTNAVPAAERVDIWQKSYAAWLTKAQEYSFTLGVVKDNPIMAGNPAECLRYSGDPLACATKRSDVEKAMGGIPQTSDSVRNGILPNPEVQVWNVFDRICENEYCFAEEAGVAIFTDNQHLSEEWTLTQVSDLERWFLDLANRD